MGLSVPFSDSYINNCSKTPIPPQKIEMIVLEKLQRINPMGLSSTQSIFDTCHDRS